MKDIDDIKFHDYLVTGFYYNSKKKFSKLYSNRMVAMGINLWKGRVWGRYYEGPTLKRRLLKTVNV